MSSSPHRPIVETAEPSLFCTVFFDAVLIFLALTTLNVLHPGTLLKATAQAQSYALTNADQRPLQY